MILMLMLEATMTLLPRTEISGTFSWTAVSSMCVTSALTFSLSATIVTLLLENQGPDEPR